MRLDTPNSKQSAHDRERTAMEQHQRATTVGVLVVPAAAVASMLVWFFTYLPASAPNSTSTSAVVDPGHGIQT